MTSLCRERISPYEVLLEEHFFKSDASTSAVEELLQLPFDYSVKFKTLLLPGVTELDSIGNISCY